MVEPPIEPPIEVRTARLVLRFARTGDGPALHEAIAVPLNEFFPWLSFSAKLSDVETLENVSQRAETAILAGEFYVWRVWDSNGLMIGSIDVHTINRAVPSCHIGYLLRSDRTGLGYAQEFVTAAIDVAFDCLKVERIEVRCDERNVRSWRLAERLGFSLEGVARNSDRDAASVLSSEKVNAILRVNRRGG